MNRDQMIARCPNSKPFAKAKLLGFRFAINSRGVATIVPDKEEAAWGVVWKISPLDEARLDLFEGIKMRVYLKRTIEVSFANNRQKKALTYVARNSKPGIPRIGYIDKIIEGAKFFGLPQKYITQLERFENGK